MPINDLCFSMGKFIHQVVELVEHYGKIPRLVDPKDLYWYSFCWTRKTLKISKIYDGRLISFVDIVKAQLKSCIEDI